MADDKNRYVVTVEQDCCIQARTMTRVVELDTLEHAEAIRVALDQVVEETGYDFWQSDEVQVTCRRTA